MLHPRVGVEVAVMALALAKGDVYVDRKGLHSAAIIARANRRQLCPNRPPALVSGESRGRQPLWQEVWRMCLHKLLFLTAPFLPGRGPGGWSPARVSGESRGGNLSGKRYGGCASINSSSLLSPFLPGKGPGGWSKHPAPSQGSPEGCAPLAGVWGCLPNMNSRPPASQPASSRIPV